MITTGGCFSQKCTHRCCGWADTDHNILWCCSHAFISAWIHSFLLDTSVRNYLSFSHWMCSGNCLIFFFSSQIVFLWSLGLWIQLNHELSLCFCCSTCYITFTTTRPVVKQENQWLLHSMLHVLQLFQNGTLSLLNVAKDTVWISGLKQSILFILVGMNMNIRRCVNESNLYLTNFSDCIFLILPFINKIIEMCLHGSVKSKH